MSDTTTPADGASEQSSEAVELLNRKLDALIAPLGEAQAKHAIAWYDYQRAVMQYNQSLLDWQLLAANILLWTVVVVVVAGVIYSGIQLTAATRLRQRADSSFEISAQRIRVTSSVVGIVVLVLSLVFLLIFVQQVYTIKGIELQPRPS
jgi:hypothetical protein